MVNVAQVVRASICGVEEASSNLVFHPVNTMVSKFLSGHDGMADMLGLGPSEL